MGTRVELLEGGKSVPAARRMSSVRLDVAAAGAAFCATPLSIAGAEILLGIGLAARIFYLFRYRERNVMPHVFTWWLAWAGLELISWLRSPQPSAGVGEIRHLLLIAALFFILPALHRTDHRMTVWRGLFATATAGSLSLIVAFAARAVRYHSQIASGGDPAFYLRTGGLLHHWMVYAVVEVLVFGGLLEFRKEYPKERWWSTPALAIQCLAIALSLTRALWLACLLVYGLHLFLRRSKGVLVFSAAPVLLFVTPSGLLRPQADYYSNAERVQMWQVGWKMVTSHPLFGVGAGRVEALYTSYLAPGALAPAYHGHLHDNALQLAAQFGIPVLMAAVAFVAALLYELAGEFGGSRDRRFLVRAAQLGVVGYLITGLTDYAYGHALGLILFSFVALSPLVAGAQEKAG